MYVLHKIVPIHSILVLSMTMHIYSNTATEDDFSVFILTLLFCEWQNLSTVYCLSMTVRDMWLWYFVNNDTYLQYTILQKTVLNTCVQYTTNVSIRTYSNYTVGHWLWKTILIALWYSILDNDTYLLVY